MREALAEFASTRYYYSRLEFYPAVSLVPSVHATSFSVVPAPPLALPLGHSFTVASFAVLYVHAVLPSAIPFSYTVAALVSFPQSRRPSPGSFVFSRSLYLPLGSFFLTLQPAAFPPGRSSSSRQPHRFVLRPPLCVEVCIYVSG